MAVPPRRRLGCAAAGAALLAFLIWFVSNLFFFGDEWDAQGGSNFWCSNTVLLSVPNGDGWVVTGHRTDCEALDYDSMTYIYLHRTDQPDRSYSLVLRYKGDDPEMHWTDPSQVKIVARHVSYLDKQVIRLWDFTITYDFEASASMPPP